MLTKFKNVLKYIALVFIVYMCVSVFTSQANPLPVPSESRQDNAGQRNVDHAVPTTEESEEEEDPENPYIRKVLIIGDSMTGWLGQRLQAYGDVNGFEVATVYWDGSTLQKWAETPRLAKVISEFDPDVVFVSLGMNNIFERDPERNLRSSFNKILSTIGDRYYVWIGPPNWPGKDGGKVLVDWLREKNGEGNFFDSFNLEIQRASKTNIHPTKEGSIFWMEKFLDWIWDETDLNFKSLDYPAPDAVRKGPVYIYKRMKETLN